MTSKAFMKVLFLVSFSPISGKKSDAPRYKNTPAAIAKTTPKVLWPISGTKK